MTRCAMVFLAVAVLLDAGLAAAKRGALHRKAHPPARPPSSVRVGILPFHGPGRGEVQAAVTWLLDTHHAQVVPADEVERAADDLHASIDADGVHAVAVRLGLAAVVSGRIGIKGRMHIARIAVHDSSTGEVIASADVSGRTTRALLGAVGRTLWRHLAPVLLLSRPPPPAAPVAETRPAAARRPRRALDEVPPYPSTAKPAPAPAVAAAGPPELPPPPPPAAPPAEEVARAAEQRPLTGPAAIELSVGPRMVYRQLTYDTDPDGALTPFRTRRPAPALGLEAAWFPRLGHPRVGVAAALEYGAPLESHAANDLSYQLPNSDALASLLVGHAFRMVTVDAALGGGRQRFGVVPEGLAISRPRAIPDVTYQYVRAGASVHVYTHSRVGLCGGAFYRHVLSSGAIASEDWFPSLRARGAEARVGVSYRFLPSLEARLHGDVRFYRFAIDPAARGGHVTAGAKDQYWSAWLALAVLLGGEAERQ